MQELSQAVGSIQGVEEIPARYVMSCFRAALAVRPSLLVTRLVPIPGRVEDGWWGRVRAPVAFTREISSPCSAGALYAASNLIGAACGAETDAFLACKAKSEDPVQCVDVGRNVTACGLNVFRSIYSGPCADTFRAYVSALERNNLEFDRARAEEEAFVSCIKK